MYDCGNRELLHGQRRYELHEHSHDAEIRSRLPHEIDIVASSLNNRLRYGENPHQAAALYTLPDAAAAYACLREATARQRAVVQQLSRSRQRAGHRAICCRRRAWSWSSTTILAARQSAENVWRSSAPRLGRRSGQRVWFRARFQCAGRCGRRRVSCANRIGLSKRSSRPNSRRKRSRFLRRSQNGKPTCGCWQSGKYDTGSQAAASSAKSAAACFAKRPTICPTTNAEWKVVTDIATKRSATS